MNYNSQKNQNELLNLVQSSKIFLITILIITYSFDVFSQEGTRPQVFAIPENLPHFEKGKDHYKDFQDAGIDYYTGIASFQIPIINLKGNFLESSISANYSSNAIKVDEVASVIGTGWSLSAGASITREIRGNSDFEPLNTPNQSIDPLFPDAGPTFDYIEGFFPHNSAEWNGCIQGAKFENNHESNEGQFIEWFVERNLVKSNNVDLEPDLFQLNIPGYSTPFHISFSRYDGVNQIDAIAHKGKVKIYYPSKESDEWTVKLDNGIIYTFGGTGFHESMKFPLSIMGSSGTYQNRVTAWYVKEIVHPTGERIEFEYLDYDLDMGRRWLTGLQNVQALTDFTQWCSLGGSSNHTSDWSTIQKKEIKRITIESSSIRKEIVFNYGERNLIPRFFRPVFPFS